MQGNTDKCCFLVSTSQKVKTIVKYFKIKNSGCEKVLVVKFDSTLTFDQHITEISRKGSRKIHTLAIRPPLMKLSKPSLLLNTFFKSQVNYSQSRSDRYDLVLEELNSQKMFLV